MLKTDLLLNLNERKGTYTYIHAMSADKQESLVAIEDLNWHMQDEESIYNCAVVRVDLSSQQ